MSNKNIDNPYEFDKDVNGQLRFTKKNIDFVNAIIANDSNYRDSLTGNDENYSRGYIKNHRDDENFPKENHIKEIVRLIDVENSTHLSASPDEDRPNIGRVKTSKMITGISNLRDRLEKGDAKLVREIAGAVKGKNNFSFASKFCTYMCRYWFEGRETADNYCIYDGVMKDILPYYAWFYLGKDEYLANKNSNIEKKFKDKKDYVGYRDLIDEIRATVEVKENFAVSREEFDRLLWYYYKGSDNRIKEANSFILECRKSNKK